MNRLPMLVMIMKAVNYSLAHYMILVKAAAVWLVLLAALVAVFVFSGGSDYFGYLAQENDLRWQNLMGTADLFPQIVEAISQRDVVMKDMGNMFRYYFFQSWLLILFAFYSTAVSWHRAILLDEKPPLIRIGVAEFKYFFFTVLFVAIWAVVAFFTSYFPFVGGTFLMVACTLLVPLLGARTLIKLPGIAIGKKHTSAKSVWEITKGNSVQLFVGLMLISIIASPFFIAAYFLATLDILAILNLPLQLLLQLLGMGVILAYLSFCYQFFVTKSEVEELA